MSFQLGCGQNVFIELTNPVHGGEGWDFGEVLWSPSSNIIGGDSWGALRTVKPGDLIIHSLKTSSPHRFFGISIAKAAYIEVDYEPPKAGRWAGYKSYYKVPLQSYSAFQNPIPVQVFLRKYKDKLKELDFQHTFYDSSFVKPVQKYLVQIQPEIFSYLLEFFEENRLILFDNVLISNEDDTNNFVPPNPPRVQTTITRVIRDTKIIRELKIRYSNKCQICGKSILLPDGNYYSEGHHLQKLGSLHAGPDIKENIMVLCPYHHTEFDYGSIAIKDNQIVHIDTSNEFNGKTLAYERADLGLDYIKYHNEKIFRK